MGYLGLDALFELISPDFRCQNVRTVVTMDVAPIWTQGPQPVLPAAVSCRLAAECLGMDLTKQ